MTKIRRRRQGRLLGVWRVEGQLGPYGACSDPIKAEATLKDGDPCPFLGCCMSRRVASVYLEGLLLYRSPYHYFTQLGGAPGGPMRRNLPTTATNPNRLHRTHGA